MDYFIKYKDGSKEIVPEQVAEAVLRAETPKIAWTGKNGRKQIDLAMISKVLSEKDYYEQYPKDRPHNDIGYISKELLKRPVYTSPMRAIEKDKKRLGILIKSLKDYIASKSYRGKNGPKVLLLKMEHKLNKLT